MKDDFTDRLLEEGLKHYSRVSAPEGFEERLKTRLEARDQRSPRATRWGELEVLRWFWLAPVAAALATAVLLLRPATPPAPGRTATTLPAPVGAHGRAPLPSTAKARSRPAEVPLQAPRPRFRILTAQELARIELPAALFAPREEKPLTDLEVPEINIPPLRIGEETKEK